MKKALRRAAGLLLCGILLVSLFPLAACARPALFTATFLDAFDTVLTVQVSARRRADAEQAVRDVHERTLDLHRQFDIYHEWSGVNNLRTVNKSAGNGTPVSVPPDVLALLRLGLDAYELTSGKVNIVMGAVLSLWHEARTDGTRLPDPAALEAAAAHVDPSLLVIDEEGGTVMLTDPAASLDVGAIAKGYASAAVRDMLADRLSDGTLTGVLYDLGGNVLALGTPEPGGAWRVGIRDPQTGGTRNVLSVTDTAVVTSGADMRTFSVDGVDYPHIIDPATRQPGRLCLSVTLTVPLSEDGGDVLALSDALSTALFLMTPEEGRELLAPLGDKLTALWVLPDGSEA